jgi:hypothetical protein
MLGDGAPEGSVLKPQHMKDLWETLSVGEDKKHKGKEGKEKLNNLHVGW